MKSFIIENDETGHVFGVFEGRDADAAIREMYRVAGDDPENYEDCLIAKRLDYVYGTAAIEYARILRKLTGDEVVKLVDARDIEERDLPLDCADEVCGIDPELVRLVRVKG